MNFKSFTFVSCVKNEARLRQDPAFQYRCINIAHELSDLGRENKCIHFSELSTKAKNEIFIFQRPSTRSFFQHWKFIRKLKKLKANGCLLIADFDDLVFAPDFAEESPGVKNGSVSVQQTRENYQNHQRTLFLFDAFTFSTEPLLETFLQFIPSAPVLQVPNTAFWTWASKPITNRKPEADDKIILTYFPGTASHDRDFRIIEPALERLLNEEEQVELHITGVLQSSLIGNHPKVKFNSRVPFEDYWKVAQQGTINLAPLEMSHFNHCKSALKGIEGSFWNKRTIATAIPDMTRLEHCGVTLVHDADSWYATLKQTVEEERERIKTGRTHNFNEQLLVESNISKVTQNWLQWLSKLKNE
ncbi:Glycosyl transferases group 1 [Idiomarinaceae bacterium HL-53]|nr:Glycosyl transferases group 1 [Idiomarinaceae bacterium HL-53]